MHELRSYCHHDQDPPSRSDATINYCPFFINLQLLRNNIIILCYFFQGRARLKDTAVPTIFSHSKEKEDNPAGEEKEDNPAGEELILLGMNKQVSDISISVGKSTKEVADVDNGGSSKNLTANRAMLL